MLNVILFITSCALYLISPYQYDGTIIVGDLLLFLIGTIKILCKNRKDFNILSFNSIFLLSFFFCTYSYALFVIGTGVEFSMTIFGFTDFNYITKSISLSTIAITAYFGGYQGYHRKIKQCRNLREYIDTSKTKIIRFIRIILAFCVVANALLFLASGNDSAAITTAAFIPELYKIFLIIYLLMIIIRRSYEEHNLKNFILANKFVIIESSILCFLYLIVGDRGLPISIVFIFLGVYSLYYKKIQLSQFAILAIIGSTFLFAIRVTRASDNSLANGGISAVASATTQSLSGQSAVLIFSDLMGTSSELCLGYEYVDKFGLQYPGKIILIPLYPFPLLPSITAQLIWGKVPYDLAASSILNDYIGKSYGYNSSLGNHIVADIYIHWGLLGVIIMFLIFGKFIGYLDKNKYSNFLVSAIYIFALSYALYLPRDSMLTLVRPTFFIFLIFVCFKLSTCNKNICVK